MKSIKGLTPDWLSELTQEHTDKEIGEMFGVTSKAIQKRRARLGIKPGSRRRFNPDPDELRRLYEQMPAAKIGEHYGVGETVVWSRLDEHGIVDRSGSDWGHRRKPGSKHSPEHLRAIRKAAKRRRGKWIGEKSATWRGGISGTQGRSRADHKDWKAIVYERANNQCENCGVKRGHVCPCCNQTVRLHAHHIKPYSEFPELRYDPNNGKALCTTCHYNEHFCQDN